MSPHRHTFYKLYYHFIWGTKNNLPLITPDIEKKLYPYIANKCKEHGYRLYALNGTETHVHLLVSLTPSLLVEDFAKNIKGSSSHYINKVSGLDDILYWQDGYGVVTIRESEVPKVIKYIQNQKPHHQGGDLSDTLERLGE
jgi:REP element-mobilizing transposase RayT